MRLSRRSLWLLVALLPGLALPLMWGGAGTPAALARLSGAGLATAVGLVAVCWLCNAARVRLLLNHLGARLGPGEALRTLLAIEFALNTLPANSGGVVGWGLAARRAGLRGTDGVAAYACDQAVDLAFFATAVPVVGLWAWADGGLPLPGLWLSVQCAGSVGLLAGVLVALRAATRQRSRRRGWLARLGASRRLRARVHALAGRVRGALGALRTLPVGQRAVLLALATAHWVARYSILAVLVQVLGQALPWAWLFVAQTGALALAQAVPLPGGGGSAEGALGVLLATRLEPGTVGAALLAWRVCTFHLYLLAGAVAGAAMFASRGRRVDLGRTAPMQTGGDA